MRSRKQVQLPKGVVEVCYEGRRYRGTAPVDALAFCKRSLDRPIKEQEVPGGAQKSGGERASTDT